MSPTLLPDDRVLVLRYCPKRLMCKGRIVLIRQVLSKPMENDDLYIKRVIGLPGETLITSISELNPVARAQQGEAHDEEGRRVWHIPQGHYFVRGDHPVGGFDSLSWGPIPFRYIAAIAILKLPRRTALNDNEKTELGGGSSALLPLQAGEYAPEFCAKTLHGEHISCTDYASRTLVLIFISPTCNHCRDALPGFEAQYPRATTAGIQFVLVSLGDAESSRRLVSELVVTIPLLIAPPECNPFMQEYRVAGTPSYCHIDGNGVVRSAGYPSTAYGGWKAMIESWATCAGDY